MRLSVSFILPVVSLGITPCYNSFENNFTLRTGAVMYGADTMKNKYPFFVVPFT